MVKSRKPVASLCSGLHSISCWGWGVAFEERAIKVAARGCEASFVPCQSSEERACLERLRSNNALNLVYQHLHETLGDDLTAWTEFLTACVAAFSLATGASRIRRARIALRKELKLAARDLEKIQRRFARCRDLAGEAKAALPEDFFGLVWAGAPARMRAYQPLNTDPIVQVALQSRKNSEELTFIRCFDTQIERSQRLRNIHFSASKTARILLTVLDRESAPGLSLTREDWVEAYASVVRDARRSTARGGRDSSLKKNRESRVTERGEGD